MFAVVLSGLLLIIHILRLFNKHFYLSNAERINGILKTEFGLDMTFRNYSYAIELLAKSVYAYNNLRLHMSCNYLIPEQIHLQNKLKIGNGKINSPKSTNNF